MLDSFRGSLWCIWWHWFKEFRVWLLSFLAWRECENEGVVEQWSDFRIEWVEIALSITSLKKAWFRVFHEISWNNVFYKHFLHLFIDFMRTLNFMNFFTTLLKATIHWISLGASLQKQNLKFYILYRWSIIIKMLLNKN